MVTLHRLALLASLATWLATTSFACPEFGPAAAGPVIVFASLLGGIVVSSLAYPDRAFPPAVVALLWAALPIVGGIMTASLVLAQGAEWLAAAAYLTLRLADRALSWRMGGRGGASG
jgi:hypothetical protein